MRWMILGAFIAATLCGSLFLPGCGRSGDNNKIKVGSLQSMTGDTSTFGQSSNKGIMLATEERNKAGGLLGKQIDIIPADDQSQNAQVRQMVLKLIDQDHVCAILGEVASGRTAAAALDCQRNKVPLLSPASTRNDVTSLGDYIFRSCFTDALQGKWIADFAAKNLKVKRAALFTDVQNPYSVGLSDVIAAEFTKAGGTIVVKENYATGAQDFQSQLTNIRAANPEVVFLPGYYTEIVKILPQARKLGITAPFVGGDGWDSDDTIKQGGDAVNGCYYTNHYAPDDPDPRVQAFVKKFKARYDGEVPDAMAVLGYDAANILFAAIQRAGSTDGPKIRDALAQTKDFPGVTGNITIDPGRNAVKPGVVLEIAGGKLKMVAPRRRGGAECRVCDGAGRKALAAAAKRQPVFPASARRGHERSVPTVDQRPGSGLDLCPHRPGLHHGLRRAAPHQLRPRRRVHGRGLCRLLHHALAPGTHGVWRLPERVSNALDGGAGQPHRDGCLRAPGLCDRAALLSPPAKSATPRRP